MNPIYFCVNIQCHQNIGLLFYDEKCIYFLLFNVALMYFLSLNKLNNIFKTDLVYDVIYDDKYISCLVFISIKKNQ
jgi:hypothetical protein